jgi:hypothetical protein
VLPRDEAITHIKKSIEKTYGKRGPEIVRRNCEVVDLALAHLPSFRFHRQCRRRDRARHSYPSARPILFRK